MHNLSVVAENATYMHLFILWLIQSNDDIKLLKKELIMNHIIS